MLSCDEKTPRNLKQNNPRCINVDNSSHRASSFIRSELDSEGLSNADTKQEKYNGIFFFYFTDAQYVYLKMNGNKL